MTWYRIEDNTIIDWIYSKVRLSYPRNIVGDLIKTEQISGFSDGYSFILFAVKCGWEYITHWGNWADIKEFLSSLTGYNIYFLKEMNFYGLNIIKSGDKWRLI